MSYQFMEEFNECMVFFSAVMSLIYQGSLSTSPWSFCSADRECAVMMFARCGQGYGLALDVPPSAKARCVFRRSLNASSLAVARDAKSTL